MDPGLRGPSRTALMAAIGRALHRDGPGPHVLDDWMAAPKRRRLAELHIALPHNVVFTAVDFETQSLRDALKASGFAFYQRAVVSWIGVTMYLAREAIDATIGTVAGCAPGTRFVLTFDQPPDVLDEKGRALLADVSGIAEKFGEPFVSLFRRDEMERLLVGHGFDAVTHFGAEDAVRRYFGGRDAGMPDVQRLATAAVAER